MISCGENEKPAGEEEIFWIHSYPILCNLNLPNSNLCLGISRTAEPEFDFTALERIPAEIEGFTLKPYTVQQIKVLKITQTNQEEPVRKLIEILAEEKDYYELLEGTWEVKSHLGESLPNANFPDGQTVYLSPPIKRTANSTDGCNSISLEIRKVGPDQIQSFGGMMTTAMACIDKTPISPFPGLGNKFKREGNTLTFYTDKPGEETIWVKKL